MAEYNWPAGAAVSIAAVGSNGAPIPTSSMEIGVKDGSGNLQPVIQGQATMASSLPVVIASDQALPIIGSVTETAPATDTASSGLNGRLQRVAQRLTSLIALLPASLGSKVSASSLAVVVASDQAAIPVTIAGNQATNVAQINGVTPLMGNGVTGTGSLRVTIASDTTTNTNPLLFNQAGRSQANAPVYNLYSGTNVTTAAYVQLVASTTSATSEIEIYDTSGSIIFLATGAAASEVNQIIIPQGGNGRIPLKIAAGTRVSVKAVDVTAATGALVINFYT